MGVLRVTHKEPEVPRHLLHVSTFTLFYVLYCFLTTLSQLHISNDSSKSLLACGIILLTHYLLHERDLLFIK